MKSENISMEQKTPHKLMELLDILWIILIFVTLLWFPVIMEIVKKGSIEVLIALVISSFNLAFLPLGLNERCEEDKIKLINTSQMFIVAGLLMSTGFTLPFFLESGNLFLFSLVHFLMLFGIILFILGCTSLLFTMKKMKQAFKKSLKKVT